MAYLTKVVEEREPHKLLQGTNDALYRGNSRALASVQASACGS